MSKESTYAPLSWFGHRICGGCRRIAVGIGKATGANRVKETTKRALSFPLLGHTLLARGDRVLLIVQCGRYPHIKDIMKTSETIINFVVEHSQMLFSLNLGDEPCSTIENKCFAPPKNRWMTQYQNRQERIVDLWSCGLQTVKTIWKGRK